MNCLVINMTKVERALFDRRWDSRAGLYFQGSLGHKSTVDYNVTTLPIMHGASHYFVGCRVLLHGFAFDTLFDDEKTNPYPWGGFIKRPSELIWKNSRREHHIILLQYGSPEASVTMEEGPPVPSPEGERQP